MLANRPFGGSIPHYILVLLMLSMILACGRSASDPTPTAENETADPQRTRPVREALTEAAPDASATTDHPQDQPTAENPSSIQDQTREPEPIVYTADGKPCARLNQFLATTGGIGQNPLGEDVTSSALLFKLPGDDSAFTYAAFSPDGDMIVTLDGRRLRLWPANRGASEPILEFENEGDQNIGRPAFSPNGRLLAIPVADDFIHLLDVSTGADVKTINARADVVAFDPTGQTLASAFSSIARLHEVETGQEIARYEGVVVEEIGGDIVTVADGHALRIVSIGFSPDGQALLTAGIDGTIRLWETASGRPLRCYESQEDSRIPFYSAAISPDGRLIIGQRDDTIIMWEALTGEILRDFDTVGENHFLSAVFGPDSRTILSADEDRTIRAWNVTSGRVEAFMHHPDVVNWAAFDPSGQKVIAALGAGDFAFGAPPVNESWVWDATHRDVILGAEAQNLVQDAIALMLAGDLSGGRDLIQQAHAINPFAEYDLADEGLNRGVQALLDHGVELALGGESDGALDAFNLAQDVMPDPDLYMITIGINKALTRLANQVEDQAEGGQIDEALVSAATARSFGREQPLRSDTLNQLCRYGSLWDRAADVIDACEMAVSLAGQGFFAAETRDSRGIARSMLGDFDGAIDDFSYFVDDKSNDPFYAEEVTLRQSWISELAAGLNPIDPATMAALREG